MDPFTQRMLEKAEQRSRALGISNASKFALSDASATDVDGSATRDAGVAMAAETKQMVEKRLPQKQQQQQLPLRSPAQSAHASHRAHTNTSTSSTNTNSNSTGTGSGNKLQVVEKTPPIDASISSSATPNKVLRQFSAVDKENMDLGIEINIMTDKNVEVQVQVEEQDVTDDEDRGSQLRMHSHEAEGGAAQPIAKLRDTARSRLQRLGALYSNPNDLSSPIHRTEGQFHVDSSEEHGVDTSPKRPKQRYGKLIALANSINEWEDDTSHHNYHSTSAVPPPKPDLPSRRVKAQAPAPPVGSVGNDRTGGGDGGGGGGDGDALSSGSKTKHLKWDPKVITSLEAQGFQRRDSSTVKLAYDYTKDKYDEDNEENQEKQPPKVESEKSKMTKMASVFTQKTGSSTARSGNAADEEKSSNAEKRKPAVKSGLVSGRAAAFESKATSSQQPQRPQKDPTELSLRERMLLFEKNKGEAPMPKAAFGMAPSISQIRQDQTAKKETAKPTSGTSTASSISNLVKPAAESKVRDKVAALVANSTTISENKIKADIHKQRQEDMQVLANRFHKRKDIFSKDPQAEDEQTNICATPREAMKTAPATSAITTSGTVRPPPPPPPPPMQAAVVTSNAKRRSPGDNIDEESKRARKSTTTGRLYPALSDLESNESHSDNERTTATVSGRSTADELRKDTHRNDADDDDTESYMESEADDSTTDICNGTLGREIMQVVCKKDNQKRMAVGQQQQHQQQHKQTKPQQQHQLQSHMKGVHYADRDHYYGGAGGDSSINSSEASMGVDDYLDEALDDDGDDDCTQESGDDDVNSSRCSRESKGTTASNSFSFRKTPKKYANYQTISEEVDDYQTPGRPPITAELSVNREEENTVTLVHTVSFYRRQQSANSANSTPVRKICREQQVVRSNTENSIDSDVINCEQEPTSRELFADEADTQSESDVDESHLVQDKIKKLLDEVCKQQQIIGQTSQALNLCAATIEFSGSTESVEGERHLLVATHRRQACLDEVQRLRVEKTLRPLGAPKEKGHLTVKEITIPLRQDYIRKLATDTISGHHLVCLLKYNEHVLATKTVPTLPGLLAVKFPDTLQMNNVYADFRVTLEIYGMTAHREVLPHEVKYHINLNKKCGIKTPKKKGSENCLVMPPVQSPAGPYAVRSPALVQYGFAIFSLREIQRTTWTLTQVLGVSPLEGVVHMKVNCELSVSVEYKGFLTMFEDVSGFGAWHRRWCHLNGTVINYWKYPDDEKKKAPMGSIDLYTCSSQKVAIAPRDICARLNTLLLECQRPAKDSDRESLIIVPNGRTTIVRHLLSADTREERDEWCAYFNKALTLLRAWGPPQ